MRIGFEAGPGGNHNGIGEHVRALSARNIPATIVANDVMTGLGDALDTGVAHTLVWRAVRDGSEKYAVPDYSVSPEAAAQKYADLIMPLVPPELDRTRVHIAIGNELDKNRANWIGVWLYHTARLFEANGFRVVGPNWASGTPEPEAWQTDGMLTWLHYLNQNRQHALGLHEYSYSSSLFSQFGWLVGRYRIVHEVCAQQSIGVPDIIMTEFGWQATTLPDPVTAMVQLEELRETDPDYPPAAIWYLGSGYGGIAEKAQKLIDPVTRWMLDTYEEPGTMPRGTPRTQYERVYNVIPTTATEERAVEIFLEGWRRSKETAGGSYDDAGVGDLNTRIARLHDIPVSNHQEFRDWYATHYPGVVVEFAGSMPSGVVSIPVPYLSQWGATASRFTGDCGPACVAMVASYFGRLTTVDEATYATGQTDPHSTHITNEIQPGLKKLGVNAVFERPLTPENIYAHIDNGKPIVVLLDYEYITIRMDTGFTGGHYVVVVGYTDNEFIVNDPDWWGSRINEGDHLRIPNDQIINAMSATGWQGLVCTKAQSPIGDTVDLMPYFVPNVSGRGPVYTLLRQDGSQEMVQIQTDGRWFYVAKGTGGRGGKSEWEQLYYDDTHIWRGLDTSPGSGLYYLQWEDGHNVARWCKRHMAPGETYIGPNHHVQFFDKATCREVDVPWNGDSTNVTTLFRHYPRYQFPTGVTLDNVVELGKTDGEIFYLAKGIGMVGWKVDSRYSWIDQIFAPGQRPDLVKETLC